MFNINFKSLVFQATPFFLRKIRLINLLSANVKPLKDINNNSVVVERFGQKSVSLFQFERFVNNFLIFSSQVIYLEKYLNDIWDPTLKRIKIVNTNISFVLYLFNNAENADPVFLFNEGETIPPPETQVFLFNEIDTFPEDYKIQVPFSVSVTREYNEILFRSQVDQYNALAREYIIEII